MYYPTNNKRNVNIFREEKHFSFVDLLNGLFLTMRTCGALSSKTSRERFGSVRTLWRIRTLSPTYDMYDILISTFLSVKNKSFYWISDIVCQTSDAVWIRHYLHALRRAANLYFDRIKHRCAVGNFYSFLSFVESNFWLRD